MPVLTKSIVAEFVGTFALVFVGAGAVIVESHTGMSHLGVPDGKVGLVGIALAHGLTLAAMIYALGSISGAHFNPAVSFAFWLQEKLDPNDLLFYTLAQLAGALTASLFLSGFFPDEISLAALGTPSLAPKITSLKGAGIEAVITFLLVTTILYTTDDGRDKRLAGVAIGASLTSLFFIAGPLTGAAANPARYLGPALLSRQLSEFWVYLAGPMLGGGLASMAFGFVRQMSPATGGSENVPDEDGPSRGPAVAKPEMITGNPDAILRRAREVFDQGGKGKEAAALLVPLLANVDSYSQDFRNSLRALLIVIEEETGPLDLLDTSRHLVRPVEAPPSPSA
jgi:aquaporin TIP